MTSGWGSITRTVQTPSGQLGNARISNVLKEADFNYLSQNSPNLVNVLGINPSSVSSECSQNHLVCIKPVSRGDSVCNGNVYISYRIVVLVIYYYTIIWPLALEL